MNVLIVDDEEPIRRICERVLREDGYAVSTAVSGAEAVLRLDENWDVILTDIMMVGGVDGLEVLRRAKRAGSADVLMMTAFPELDSVLAALKAGAYDFILKPFSPELLRAAVRRCADKRRLSLELAREKALRVELARMQRIKDAFGQFVTREIVEHVLALPAAQRGRGARRRVTMLFADVRKFTPFAEAFPPEVAVDALNEFFSCVISALRHEGGILNKFLGDGVLGLFGAPLDLAGHERAAARAALRVMAAVKDLDRARQTRGLPPLRIGIGINTGDVVAGCLGTESRTEYSVIGRAVNMAARLENAAKPGQILLGPETAAALGDEFVCRPVSALTLRGVSEPGAVCELLSGASDAAHIGR